MKITSTIQPTIIRFPRLVEAIAMLLVAAGVGPVRSATLVVTNPGDTGAGSLRQAILSANFTTNVPDLIQFNIAGTGPHTINPVTPLPSLMDPVVLDGYSQPGASVNTLPNGDNAVIQIVVRGRLVIDTTNSVVRGLAIPGIQVGEAPGPKGSNVIEGCFIGLDATGTNALGLPGTGVFVQTPGNRIGGRNPAARNLISGRDAVGIEIFEGFASNNVVQGNFIGTDRTGTKAIGNSDRAVVVNQNASATLIGGETAGAGNVISGNLDRGITLDGGFNVVMGNWIGTTMAGQPLGNGRTGIEIGGPVNTIGALQQGAGNVIAYNGLNGRGIFTTNGVDVKPGATLYSILGNSIFDNAGLGIDVNADGVLTLGFPVLTLASNTGNATIIKGQHMPNASLFLQLFINPAADEFGYGEGKTLLTFTNIATDAGGNFTINWPTPLSPGLFLTATANARSEFSEAHFVTAATGTNSWTMSLGGKWENGTNWSLNVSPYVGHSLVSITNAATKTVVNDATTASQFPNTMTISNLTIGAPSGATNTLLLAHGGTSTPLRLFNALNVNNGGALVISNAALSLEGNFNGSSRIDGSVTFLDGSLVSTNPNNRTYIGHSGRGTLTISNGLFESYYPIVGLAANSHGTWNIAGGVTRVTATFDIADSLTATGRVVMTDGELYTPSCYVGLFGNGSLVVSNGFMNCEGQILLGSQPGSVGNFTVAGGYIYTGSIVVSEGFQSTGNLLMTSTGEVYSVALEARTGGTIRMEGGSLGTEHLFMNETSQLIFNRGELLTRSVTISNNVPFVVGDGTNAARYLVYHGGTNTFPKGLRIAPNSTLGGSGYLVGMITNTGVINPGYNFQYRSDLEIAGGLVLANNSDLRFDLTGDTNILSDFISTSGNVILGGKLSLSFADFDPPISLRTLKAPAKFRAPESNSLTANSGATSFPSLVADTMSTLTNGASFVLLVNDNNLTGNFTNVASGGLLTTTDGYGCFTVLYANSKMLLITNLVISDSDGDGMPNWWEDEYGLNKNVADGALDFDSDGASNIAEFHAGTQPNNNDSAFRIVSLQRETNSTRITWTTVMGKSYRLQTNAPVNGSLSTNFFDASPIVPAPNDDYESKTNFLHIGGFTNAPARYYRICLEP